MFWRKLQKTDLQICLRTHPEALSGVTDTTAYGALSAVADTPSFMGVVVESKDAAGRATMVASGASVFVDEEFALAEVENPRPGLMARILSAELDGHSVVLNRDKIAKANATTGLSAVTLWAALRSDTCSLQMIDSVLHEFFRSYPALRAGYFHRRVLFEIVDINNRIWVQSLGIARILEFRTSFQEHQGLALLEPSTSRALDVSLAGPLFRQHRPILGLTAADQELLLAVLEDDLPDADLARRLNLSVSAIKRRWEALYARIETSCPSLFQNETLDDSLRKRGERGVEKRRRVFHYVRNHPEELRPFDSKARSLGRRGIKVFRTSTT